jgi:hypothetical protein
MSSPEDLTTEETWVNVTEAAELTGYYHGHIRKLARENWNLPADERFLRIRRRSNRYDIWLPDLMQYMQGDRNGPKPHIQKDE